MSEGGRIDVQSDRWVSRQWTIQRCDDFWYATVDGGWSASRYDAVLFAKERDARSWSNDHIAPDADVFFQEHQWT